ncbi:unnamed protein product, partial [Sphagnum jensenii]
VKSLKQRSRIGAMEDPTQGSLQAHAHCIQQLVLEKKLLCLGARKTTVQRMTFSFSTPWPRD